VLTYHIRDGKISEVWTHTQHHIFKGAVASVEL